MKRWIRLATAAIAALAMLAPVAAEAASKNPVGPDAAAASSGTTLVAEAHAGSIFQRFHKRSIAASNPFARQVVEAPFSQPVGTIVVDTGSHFLYLMIGDGQAMRYGIGV